MNDDGGGRCAEEGGNKSGNFDTKKFVRGKRRVFRYMTFLIIVDQSNRTVAKNDIFIFFPKNAKPKKVLLFM